jgi:hypothetical protein
MAIQWYGVIPGDAMEQGITCYEVLGLRPEAIPDVCGLFHPCAQARRYRLHVTVVRLTERPMAVDGLVVDQARSPAVNARRGDALTVQVSHPPARSHRQTMSLPDCPAAPPNRMSEPHREAT